MSNLKLIEVKTKFGHCYLLFYLDDVSRCYLTNLEIFKKYRRCGHASELLKTALITAKRQNVTDIILQVIPNSFVCRWYEKFGFRELNVFQYSPQNGHIWMVKHISRIKNEIKLDGL